MAVLLFGNSKTPARSPVTAADRRFSVAYFSNVVLSRYIHIFDRIASHVLVPVQPILDRVHRQLGTVGGVVEAGLGKVDVEGGIVDMAREGGKDIVAVVVVHQLVRADRLTPGVILQFGKALPGGLGCSSGCCPSRPHGRTGYAPSCRCPSR